MPCYAMPCTPQSYFALMEVLAGGHAGVLAAQVRWGDFVVCIEGANALGERGKTAHATCLTVHLTRVARQGSGALAVGRNAANVISKVRHCTHPVLVLLC